MKRLLQYAVILAVMLSSQACQYEDGDIPQPEKLGKRVWDVAYPDIRRLNEVLDIVASYNYYLTIDDVDEELVSKNLYTGGLDDPNLIIRTSGEERLSGFLLWQSSYSELYFCETLWPELRKVDFIRAIRSYQARDRRFGT